MVERWKNGPHDLSWIEEEMEELRRAGITFEVPPPPPDPNAPPIEELWERLKGSIDRFGDEFARGEFNETERGDLSWVWDGIEELRKSGVTFEVPQPAADPDAPPIEELWEQLVATLSRFARDFPEVDAA